MASVQPNYQPLIKPAAQRLVMQMQTSSTDYVVDDAAGRARRSGGVTASSKLSARRFAYSLYEAYYDGQHRLAFATSKFREAFANLFSAFADNWCEIVIDAPVERLVVGLPLRVGTGRGRRRRGVGDLAANNLDAESAPRAHRGGQARRAYVSILPEP
jgi:hypothetical protein